MDDEGLRRDIVGCVRLSLKLRAFSFKLRRLILVNHKRVNICKFNVNAFCTKIRLFNLDEIRDPFSPLIFCSLLLLLLTLH